VFSFVSDIGLAASVRWLLQQAIGQRWCSCCQAPASQRQYKKANETEKLASKSGSFNWAEQSWRTGQTQSVT
jgi:hypothetical protein